MDASAQRWKLTLAWDGAGFLGWQRQPQGLTIQQAVEDALSRILGGQAVTVTASGRTDTGVHAIAQIASFETTIRREPDAVVRGLNANLPQQIVCLHAERAPDGFDARRWTRRKLYRYRILSRPVRCPHRQGRVWHLRYRLDVAAMADAARRLMGSHDFSSFQASGCSAKHPDRTLESARVQQVDDEVHLEFVGNGFLRHQVRIMVGTLVDVGRGRATVSSVSTILTAADRTAAGQTAPAHGLWLVWVEVGDAPRRRQ
ncbi:MAG: tRNA pseudouridine(38-40) synthase TruA [Myxococcota bacterium]